jgi:hypothetical protein
MTATVTRDVVREAHATSHTRREENRRADEPAIDKGAPT